MEANRNSWWNRNLSSIQKSNKKGLIINKIKKNLYFIYFFIYFSIIKLNFIMQQFIKFHRYRLAS
jgi:hypothetical protein